jgi:putative DNA primase/helicase
VIVERLLSISGEDALTIDIKFRDPVTCKLTTRLMLLSNELPRLSDASGALAGRFIALRLTESFYGREDLDLTQKLLTELPGILLWAIEG